MPLQPGGRLSAYEVLGLIGSGGMGKVYRARDSKLNRDVALKVLPDEFALDADRLARFKREAQVLASLNHPNIAAIYGLEDADGVRALVLEFVEGPTLADRIAQAPAAAATSESASRGARASGGGLPLDEALPIARQIAEALEAAHEHAIVHRDLKPANIKVTPEGTVKVLDFGLAKALGDEMGGDLSNSPTMSLAATRAGVILGTAAYMAPEQAKGRPVDRRSDIWAFGCVLYEMLTGRRAFEGDDASDTLAAILRAEPDWNALPLQTPAAIRRLLRRCLEKDRKDRLRDIGDASADIKEALTAPSADVATVTTSPRRFWRWQRITPLAVGALAVATVGGGAVWLTMRPIPPRVTRMTITPSSAAALSVEGIRRDVAITPDGTSIVYVGSNGTQLFVRAMDRLEPTTLSGVGAPLGVFVSPDSQWIGFFDGGAILKKVAITGGPAVMLSSV